MEKIDISLVVLRKLEQLDLPRMYEFHIDPDANRMAATIPRSATDFETHWYKVLADPKNLVREIAAQDLVVGYISCFPHDGLDSVGYWIYKEYWGQGIASRALQLLLHEINKRPLNARVATSNPASLRVLQKAGFVVHSVQISPGNDRFLECEEAFLILN